MPDGAAGYRPEITILNMRTDGITLADLAPRPRWVGWRVDMRNGKPTKVPYSPVLPPSGEPQRAAMDNPATWGTRAQAEALSGRLSGFAGVGLALGAMTDTSAIGGVDLDTCIAPDGTMEPWAIAELRRFKSYAEVSPSGSGLKLFFHYNPRLMGTLARAMGDAKHGKKFSAGTGEHPPAIEVYFSSRFFAVTDRHLSGTPAEMHFAFTDDLAQLLEVSGPALARKGKPEGAKAGTGGGAKQKAERPEPEADDEWFNAPPGDDDAALIERLERKAAFNAHLHTRWHGDFSGMNDTSRSAVAMAVCAALKRAGFTMEETARLLRVNPHTADWMREKGDAAGGREFRRMWGHIRDEAEEAAAAAAAAEPWPEPAMSILHRSVGEPPELPLDCFPSAWRAWIKVAAEGANSPPDYVALPLLALSSAMIGNARWVMPWQGWAEPPALWCASVGDPSSGKSSGAAPIMRDVLAILETDMRRDYPAELARWEEAASVAAATEKAWQSMVKAAVKAGEEPPPRPEAARAPPRPVQPRVKVQDATIEAIGDLLSAVPKGLLHVRDELAGWLLNLSRYSSGSDRPFWLESYVGGPFQVDRKQRPNPIFIERLTLATFGTIQPDRLADCLEGADDGLASRFLWAWPVARPFKRPGGFADPTTASDRLARLERLAMPRSAGDKPVPSFVPFGEPAREVLEDFAREMQQREGGAHGLLKSSYGKARGHAARLALVLEYLAWTVDDPDAPEPREVGLQAMQDAAGLMDGYFLPMAARVLGDASIPETERHARSLAEWIVRTRPERVNVSAIRDGARLPGLRETDAAKEACSYLAEGGWLREAPLPSGRGRPRGDWLVNPRVHGGQE